MSTRNNDLREQICAVGKRLYQKGLVAGTEGNISCKLPTGEVIITPSGLCKGDLQPHNLVVLAETGELSTPDSKPSSEFRLHLSGYRNNQLFNSAVHAHAPYATAFALARRKIPASSLAEFRLLFGDIPLVPYADPGTQDLADGIDHLVASNHTLLLERHGIIAFAESLWQAYFRIEMAEQCARIAWLAMGLRPNDKGISED